MSGDNYAVAKTALRETSKLLITIYSGLAAALFAGTPFIGILNFSNNWILNSLKLLALISAFICLSIAINYLIKTLIPSAYYGTDYLESDIVKLNATNQDKFDSESRKNELKEKLKKCSYFFNIEEKSKILLNIEYIDNKHNLSKSDKHYEDLKQEYRLEKDLIFPDSKKISELEGDIINIQQWLGFIYLKNKYTYGIKISFYFGLASLLFLCLFAFLSHDQSKKANSSTNIFFEKVNVDVKHRLLFDTGSSDLNIDGINELRLVYEKLKSNSDYAALIYAHTDTTASEEYNSLLAKKRKENVIKLLNEFGDIASSRLLSTELPKRKLSLLTNDNKSEKSNRVVEVVLILNPNK